MGGYRGRFAPSPTGPLHFGSLLAATASYLDARSQVGEWLVRMEDLDRDREQPGAAESILSDLEYFGFAWDGEVVWQSRRTEAYREAFERLRSVGLVYPCACSRTEIADSMEDSRGQRYPRTCARGLAPGKSPRSWRVRVDDAPRHFDDRLHGQQKQDLPGDVGDFIVLRADGWFAYQLAVVVDDGAQEITHVVRGADLLDSTLRQIHLQGLLGLPRPAYLHIPAAVDARGDKLSKQTRALALDRAWAGELICAALRFLGQAPPDSLRRARIAEIWRWAIEAWSPDRLPRAMSLRAPADLYCQ